MNSVSMCGDDTILIDNHLFTNLGDGDSVDLSFEGEIATLKRGKNGNTVYAVNQTGNVASLKIRVLRGSQDDKFLNGLMATQQQNFAGFPLLTGVFTKKIGDGKGNVISDQYVTNGGIFVKKPGGKTNTEGNTDQGLAEYTIKFSNAPRAIG